MWGEIARSTVIIKCVTIPFSIADRKTRWKIRQKLEDLNDTINLLEQKKYLLELTDTYITFQPTIAKCTFFSGMHGTLSRTDSMLHHKTNLSKFLKVEIIKSIFSKQMKCN